MGIVSKMTLDGGFYDKAGELTASATTGDDVLPGRVVEFTAGKGPNQITDAFIYAYSLDPNSYIAFDMVGGVLNNHLHDSLTLDRIKSVMVRADNPAAPPVVFGPQNYADAAQLWFTSNTGTGFGTGSAPDGAEAVHDVLYRSHPIEGWPVDAGNKYIVLSNNSPTETITGKIWILGVNNNAD